MKKTLSILVALVLVVGLLVSFAPAREEAEGAVGSVAVGPVDGKTEKDYQFAVVAGGVNPYFDPMIPGSNDAAAALGIPEVEFQTPQNWEQNEQNAILDALIAKGVDGILMMPSNAVAGNEQITKMVDAGIPIVTVGGPPELPSKSTLTLATDVYNSAYMGTEEVIKALGEKGNIVGFSGDLSDPNTVLRFQGIKDACDKYPDVTLLQEIGDVDSAEASMTAVGDVLAASGDEIDGMISTAYYPTVAIATFLAEEQYSGIVGVGIDTDAKVLEAIKNGTMLGTMSQNPYGQAYIATVTLKMQKDGWTYKEGGDEVIDSGSFFVNADNVDEYDTLVRTVTDDIMATWTDRFNPPA